jgi:uroporphyrinogen decarboxylase
MYEQPEAWHRLLAKLGAVVAEYLTAQVDAGAQALQLFDSWVGALSPEDYREFVLPHSRRILRRLAALEVPTIHFGVGTSPMLELIQEAGGDVIGLDWRTPLSEGWRRLGKNARLQGNLDPAALFAPPSVLERKVRAILDQARGHRGHIFNLGHGLLPETPVDQVRAVVDLVHQHSA